MMEQFPDDACWLGQAMQLADQARQAGEVPVGALIVLDGQLLAKGWNCPIGTHDPTAHAEIRALRAAGESVMNYRLPGATLYVTLEPCLMCMGAIIHARISRLVYGAPDPRRGAVESIIRLAATDFLNHQVAVTPGILAEECSAQLRSFFRERR